MESIDDGTLVTGPGWQRLAAALAERIAPETITAIYAFRPIRRSGREWGTAVVTMESAGGRRSIVQARYWLQVRGRDRGRSQVEVSVVGEGPERSVHEVIAGVQARSGESDPPVPVDPRWWYAG
jgi:hypothetical protein